METKFKADPYNSKNRLIQEEEIYNLCNNLGLMKNNYFHQSYKINDISIYQKAFVHTSYTKLRDYEEYERPEDCLSLQEESYEKMEFLGDSFLGNIVSTYLFKRYVEIHNKDEGFLTKLKIRLVCGEQLAYLSEKMGLDKYIILSKHVDMNCEGRKNTHILEDVYEALLAAIYLDTGDHELVSRFVIHTIEKYIDFSDLILKDNNYKDQLLRYFQHNYKVFPIYKTNKEEDIFKCEIYMEDIKISSGEGKSKKKSEQEASRVALIQYHVISD